MSKKGKFILIIAFITLFFIGPNIPNLYKQFIVQFETLPEEFKTYKYLEGVQSDSSFNKRVFNSIYSEYAFEINDSLICLTTHHTDKKDSTITHTTWFKINNSGNIIDSLCISDEYIQDHDNYLVNIEKSYYSTWLLDGDSSMRPIQLIENAKIIDKETFKTYTNMADFSDYLYVIDSASQKRVVKTIYYKQGIWNEIYTTENYYVDINCCIDNNLKFEDISDIAILQHFNKRDWYGHSFPDFGFYINGKTPEHWKGTGFYYIKANGSKIQFKRSNLRLYKNGYINNSINFIGYQNPKKEFILITRNDIYSGSKQFLFQFK